MSAKTDKVVATGHLVNLADVPDQPEICGRQNEDKTAVSKKSGEAGYI